MQKIPTVERDALFGGITPPCAALWYAFLSEEAFWSDNRELAENYKRRSESFSGGLMGSIHDRSLEKEIEKWKR
jgi:hypothetical protein